VCGQGCIDDNECPAAPAGVTAICYDAAYCAIDCTSNGDCPQGLACAFDPRFPQLVGVCLDPAKNCTCDNDEGCAGCLVPLLVN
jgi:hypothetical protein